MQLRKSEKDATEACRYLPNTVQAQPNFFGLQHLDSPKGKMPDKVIAWVVLTVLIVLS